MAKHLLTATFLLLSLVSYTSAQNSSERETLKGLREIGVSVEYTHVDAVEITMQPNVLQRLQSTATDQLTKAGVPLLKSTDAAGHPRLVFEITANQDTDTAPAIVVQSKLYERVGLKRDVAKESDLATWVYDGVGGPRATEDMLFQVFDGQVEHFIKEYRAANATTRESVITETPQISPLYENANPFAGLKGTRVFVSFRPDATKPNRDALRKVLQSEAEARLAKAGVRLFVYGSETEPAGDPLLYLFITLSDRNSGRSAVEVEGRFWQKVRPARDPSKETYAVTWQSEGNETWPISDAAVRAVMNAQIDEFVKAYKAANTAAEKRGSNADQK